MAATAKTPNYTPEMTEMMIREYDGGNGKSVDDLAEMLNRSVRSVRSKLVREGVYVVAEKAPKAAKIEGPTKKEMLRELEELAPFAVEGFMGATKEAIAALIDFLRENDGETVATEAESNEDMQEAA